MSKCLPQKEMVEKFDESFVLCYSITTLHFWLLTHFVGTGYALQFIQYTATRGEKKKKHPQRFYTHAKNWHLQSWTLWASC